MRIRPTEKKLVRSLLENEEWVDEGECAEAIITRLDEMRGRDRNYHVLAVQYRTSDRTKVTQMYGPYGTAKEAERAYLKGTGQVEGALVGIFKMTTPEQAEQASRI